MANITLAFLKKRGDIYKEVADWEPGYADDGIFGITASGKKFQRIKKGIITCEEAGIFGDGTDQTARINTVYAHPKVELIDFNLDAGGEITVSGTVSLPNAKFYRIGAGTMIKTTGAGTFNGGIPQADQHRQVFSGTRAINPYQAHRISVNWFGANNGIDENGALITKAAQVIIKNPNVNTLLSFPDRSYPCSTPVILYNWDTTSVPGTPRYSQCFIHLKGRPTSNSGGDAALVFSNPNWFGIGIQQGKGCIIEGLRIQGTFAPTYISQKQFFEQKLVNFGGVHGHRDTRYSPHCGINFDPFRASAPPDDGYPGLPAPPEGGSSWYRGIPTNQGSSFTTVKNCNLNGWIVNYGVSMNGQTQNSDSLKFIDSTNEVSKYAMSFGQDQTKNCTVKGLLCWSRIHTLCTNRVHGSTGGAPPKLSDICIAGNVLRLFDIDTTGRNGFEVNNIFAEGLYKMGTLIGQPVSITGSNINFNMVDYQNQLGDPDVHGRFSNVSLDTCVLRNYNAIYNKRTRWEVYGCTFKNCMFDRPPIFQKQISGRPNRFVDCKLLLPPAGGSGNIGYATAVAVDFAYFVNTVRAGQVKLVREYDTNGVYTYEYEDYEHDVRIPMGTFTVTIDPATRTGSVTLPTWPGTRYNIQGLYLYTINIGAPNDVVFYDEAPFGQAEPILGRINSYDYTTGFTTIEDIQTGYATGSYVIGFLVEKFVQRPFVADMTYLDPVIRNIEHDYPQVDDNIEVLITLGKVKEVDQTAKTATMSVVANYNATDVVFNAPKSMRFESHLPPDSNALDPNIFLLKGTKWVTRIAGGGTIREAIYEITKSGFVLANGTSRVRQAEWFQVPGTRFNPVTGNFEFLNSATYMWEVISGGGGGTADVIDSFTLTADGTRVIPTGYKLAEIQMTSDISISDVSIGLAPSGDDAYVLGTYSLLSLQPYPIITNVAAPSSTTLYFSGITGKGASVVIKLRKQPFL